MAAVPKPGLGPYGPAIMFVTCTVGFLCGGVLDHWITGSGRLFGAFGAALGLSVGGLVGASLVEFILPLGLAALLLEGATPGPAAAPGQRPERLGIAGRLLQGFAVLAALVLGTALFRLGLEPVAEILAMPYLVTGLLLGFGMVGLVVSAASLGAALARHLDLTVP